VYEYSDFSGPVDYSSDYRLSQLRELAIPETGGGTLPENAGGGKQ
jgi:hypothetical protein